MKRFIFIGILFSIFNFQLPIARAQQGDEQMASYYYQNREYDKAIELYEPLYARTQSVYYYQMLYTCYLETEQFKEAEKLVEKRMKRQGRDLTLYVDLGNLHLKRGERKKAEKQYAAAVDKLGRDSKQAIDLALAYLLGFRGEAFVAILIMAAAPTAASAFTMAEEMGSNGRLTGSSVVFSTGLSVLTIFLWLFLFKTLGAF